MLYGFNAVSKSQETQSKALKATLEHQLMLLEQDRRRLSDTPSKAPKSDNNENKKIQTP